MFCSKGAFEGPVLLTKNIAGLRFLKYLYHGYWNEVFPNRQPNSWQSSSCIEPASSYYFIDSVQISEASIYSGDSAAKVGWAIEKVSNILDKVVKQEGLLNLKASKFGLMLNSNK